MQASRVATYVPAAVGVAASATLVRAPDNVPLRVVVRNVGDVDVLIAHDATAFSSDTTATFLLPKGQSETFVLAPKQGIFAQAVTEGTKLLSCAISEALPGHTNSFNA